MMTIEEIQARLKEGNTRYVSDSKNAAQQDLIRREALVDGQEPFAIILSCADSRVVPEMIFDTGLGELFVIRVAGNIANSSSIASIEYAVAHLGTKVIVVLGHQSCGAVTAAVSAAKNNEDLGKHLNHLVGHIGPAIKASSDDDAINDIVKKNAELTSVELGNSSEIIGDALEVGSLKILPAYYNLDGGKVEFL